MDSIELELTEITSAILNLFNQGYKLVKQSDVIPNNDVGYKIFSLGSQKLAVFLDKYKNKNLIGTNLTFFSPDERDKIIWYISFMKELPKELQEMNKIIAGFAGLAGYVGYAGLPESTKIYEMKINYQDQNKKKSHSIDKSNTFWNKDIYHRVNNTFWKWQYSVRHFMFKDQENYDYFEEKNAEKNMKIMEKLFDSQMRYWYLKDFLWRTIIVYHNLKHKNCEDLIFESRINKKEFNFIRKKLKKLDPDERDIIENLHKIAYDYEFFVWNLTKPFDMLKILVEYNLTRDEDTFLLPRSEPFLKKIDSTQNKIEVKCILSSDEELPKSIPGKSLTIFIDPLNKSDTISGIKKKVVKVIKHNKFQKPIGCAKKAKMAFYIDPTLCSVNRIMEVIRLNVVQYKNFDTNSHNLILPYNPEFLKDMIENNKNELLNSDLKKNEIKILNDNTKDLKRELRRQKTIPDILKQSDGICYKQKSAVCRAIGLYLWDCINFEKLSQSEAINRFINLHKDEEYKNFLPHTYESDRFYKRSKEELNEEGLDIEDFKRELRREENHADDCIASVRF